MSTTRLAGMDKFPLKLATKARACGFRVNRKRWTINRLPIPGATLEVHTLSRGSDSRMFAFGSGELVAGALVANALLSSKGKLSVTIVAEDGRRASRVVTSARAEIIIQLADGLNNLAIENA